MNKPQSPFMRRKEKLREMSFVHSGFRASNEEVAKEVLFVRRTLTVMIAQSFLILLTLLAQVYGLRLQHEATEAQVKALQEQRKAVYEQISFNLEQQIVEVSKTFIDKPELRPYFYDKKPIAMAKGEQVWQIETVAEMYLDFMEYFDTDFMYELPHMGKGEKDRLKWESYFRDLFANSPAICVQYQRSREWYGPDLCKRYASLDCKC